MSGPFMAIVAGAFVVGWALTGAARHYALSRGILDRPNERSSHSTPTPLGGGWGIATPAIAAATLAYALGWLDREAALGVVGGGSMIALVGWIDDRVGLSARPRLLAQVAAASWLVGWLGGIDSVNLGVAHVRLGPWGSALAVLALVWCTNLYNFMDGIDGLAGTEAVCVATVGGALLLLSGSIGLALVALVTAAASAGFLIWNWPPARIFMGDGGSGLIGFLLAALAFAGDRHGAVPALVWVLLLNVFVADASIVLLRRMGRGERWYIAHRGHLYQRLVQAGWSHGRVNQAVLGLNMLLSLLAVLGWRWRELLPLAFATGSVTVGVAYIVATRSLRHHKA